MAPKPKTPSKPKELRVGIYLGTSRSSVTASNGKRHVVESYVGWPAEMVARKVLKREVLVGEEALDNRTMLDLFRPLEEGLIKEGSSRDEAAVKELLRHMLLLVEADPASRDGARVRAVIGVPAAPVSSAASTAVWSRSSNSSAAAKSAASATPSSRGPTAG